MSVCTVQITAYLINAYEYIDGCKVKKDICKIVNLIFLQYLTLQYLTNI